MAIKIKNVHKTFGSVQALSGVNLEIGEGMFGLLGPNGAGKTTLMRIMTGLIGKNSGEVIMDGIDVKDKAKIREFVSYLPQEFDVYPNMSVWEVMDYMAILGKIKAKEDRKQLAKDLLTKVNLFDDRKKKVKALSGGMKRRLGIAIALINDPKILIVDEPTAGLDPEERVRFRQLLTKFAMDRTVILSTHIVGDIEHSCDRVAIIKEGNIVYDGANKELVKRAEGYVRSLRVPFDQYDNIISNYKVMSTIQEGDFFRVKLVTKELIGDEVEPNLEDAYMVQMQIC